MYGNGGKFSFQSMRSMHAPPTKYLYMAIFVVILLISVAALITIVVLLTKYKVPQMNLWPVGIYASLLPIVAILADLTWYASTKQ